MIRQMILSVGLAFAASRAQDVSQLGFLGRRRR